MSDQDQPPISAADSPTQALPPGATPSALPPSGFVLGGYRLEAPIAAGGMAVVYRAIDERLGRAVALKILKRESASDAHTRFLREIRLIAGLQHPNVVMMYGAGEDHGYAWAAMELLPRSLAQELHQGRLTASAVIDVARDACRGLDAAWQRGILHRDVKPSNLLRDGNGVVKIADFGLAKDLSIELHLTAPDVVLGTPLYLSPEQASGRATGPPSDIYSLGATLYHLVSGRPPFLSTSALDVIVRHAVEPPPPLPDDVPPPLRALILQMLEKDPKRRPADYGAVLARLDGSVVDLPPDLETQDMSPMDTDRGDGVSASLVAAARAALQMGRTARARSLLEPMVKNRGAGWVQAAFTLASALEASSEFAEARKLLEAVSTEARVSDDRALALWSLGRLAEKESSAALARAVDTYRQISGVSTSRFPKALLEARIERLQNQINVRAGLRKTSDESSR